MKNTKLKKLMQADFDSGDSLQNIFDKYTSEGIKESKLAYFVSTLKDNALIKKHKLANNILLGFMFIVTVFTVFIAYSVGTKLTPDTPIYWISIVITIVMAIIPMLFLYGFIKNTYQAYLAYIIFAVIQLPISVGGFSSSNVVYEIGVLISLFIFIFVLYLKYKIFPYMGLFWPKKNVAKQYLVAKNS